MFFTKYILFAEKKKIYMEKKIIDFFFTKKAFLEKMKNIYIYIYLIREIFFYPENIYSFCKKKFFDHKKYIC